MSAVARRNYERNCGRTYLRKRLSCTKDSNGQRQNDVLLRCVWESLAAWSTALRRQAIAVVRASVCMPNMLRAGLVPVR